MRVSVTVGGNHEASNYLRELFYGGWAAPNIYFLGFAGMLAVETNNCAEHPFMPEYVVPAGA